MREALSERNVEPVDTPDIRDVNVEEGQPLTFKAEFDVLPSFDPGDFSTIEARRSPATIDDAGVDQALDQLRERSARFEPVEDGVIGDGHTAVVDLERQGFDKDGTAGEKSRHERVPVEIGATANPPGLDDELKGLASGAEKTFRLRFPDDYTVAELAGTEAEYTVKVHDVRSRVVPALDDEFAKDLGEFETLDALKARVRQDLEAEAKDAAERQVRADVLEEAGGARAVPRARLAGRSRSRSPRRGVRAPADGSAHRSAQGQHRLGRVPRSASARRRPKRSPRRWCWTRSCAAKTSR